MSLSVINIPLCQRGGWGDLKQRFIVEIPLNPPFPKGEVSGAVIYRHILSGRAVQ